MKRWPILTLLVALALSNFSASHAADSFFDAPKDVDAIHTQLSKSLIGVECNSKFGIAFAGGYRVTDEDKNQGNRSLLVTNKALIWPCLNYSSREVKIYFDSKEYKGQIRGWSNLNSEDYATIWSALEPKTINLHSEFIPQIGWWVTVAIYQPGFGVSWVNTKISAVNLTEYSLLLDGPQSKILNGGPVFDRLGNFLGLATLVDNKNEEMTKVSGAPNQCQRAGQLSGSGVTDCWTTRDKIWVTASPSVAEKAAAEKAAAEKAAAEKAAAEKAAAEKAAAEKARQEADARAAADKILADARAAADKILADAKAAVVTKKTTISCVKGKLIKKVTAVKPICPVGYRKK